MIETSRLILRQWAEQDRSAFAELTADPEVMKYFASTLTRSQSDASIDRFAQSIDDNGWGFWAVELKQQAESLLDDKQTYTAPFIGFIGLNRPQYELPFSPCVEIGWRLSKQFWGKGYASEGAEACLAYAFETLVLPAVVSMTPLENSNSEKVMQRIGMTNCKETFEHPALEEGHVLRPHVLYKITRSEWMSK